MAAPAQTDPLANLRDIHIPGAIDPWPPAIGWWLLAALALVAICYCFFWIFRWWQSNQYRREGVRALTELLNNHESEKQYLQAYSDLLKRVALSRYPRDVVANLTGVAWVSFLDSTAKTQEFTMGEGEVLIQGNYESDPVVDVEKLHQLGLFWIKNHKNLVQYDQSTEEDQLSNHKGEALPS